ncbi:MAG: DUF4837 family protein [Rikenellaceae bacterium]|nr:DUF4837 family protein [Rikenellaceae bacterium]
MKKTTTILLLVVAAALALTGCDGKSGSGSGKVFKVSTLGAPYEIVVAASHEQWDGPLGDTVRAIFSAPVPYLNAVEPKFDVIRVLPAALKNNVNRHRNILLFNISPDNQGTSMDVRYDIYAAPQVVLTAKGPNIESVTDYLSEHRQQLLQLLEGTERDRAVDLANRIYDLNINKAVREKFGFEMRVPKGYLIRNNTVPDFMWVSFEYPQASQGFFIYSYPYTGKEDFSLDSLVAKRNRFAALIPGENPGSHMTTVTRIGEYDEDYIADRNATAEEAVYAERKYIEVKPDLEYVRIEGRFWAEMHGFWDVYKDYMGGPFTSFTTLDNDSGRVVTIDFYIYSPKDPKRNYLRGVEHLIHTVKFPSDIRAAELAAQDE